MNPENIAALIKRVEALETIVLAMRPLGPCPESDAKFEEVRKEQIQKIAEAIAPPAQPPVDRSKQCLTDGRPVTQDHRELKENGQQKEYVVLTEEERAKGFVRPVRSSYIHEKCGTLTTMARPLAETYARDPYFYLGTFCVGCGKHFPVGEEGEFVWEDGTKVGV